MPFAALFIILGFYAWWPLGLAILLFFFLGRRRMACWNHDGMSGWQHPMGGWQQGWDQTHWQRKMQHFQDKMDRARAKMDKFGGRDWWGQPASSGNSAFDNYRQETLRRLEDEQREFKDFLERLRFAKDRNEFDQFMAERRARPEDPGPQPQAPA
jgi:hypothetical protein